MTKNENREKNDSIIDKINYTHLIIMLLTSLTLLSFLEGVSYAESKDEIPYIISVGINYGENLELPITITSDDKMLFGYFDDDEFIEEESFGSNRTLYIENISGSKFKVTDGSSKLVTYNSDSEDYVVITTDEADRINENSDIEDDIDPIEVNGKSYRGGIIVAELTDGSNQIINRVRFEDYICGVLPKEMSVDWPIEALKAQAIAARNFGMISMTKHSDLGFDLCDTSNCQVYGGYDVEGQVSNEAVRDTEDELLYFDGEIVATYYHSSSGGYTADVANVWSTPLGYLVETEDPFSLDAPNSGWNIELTKSELEKLLWQNGYNIGNLYNVNLDKSKESGRVMALEFEGSKDDFDFPKQDSRTLFGYNTLKSMLFTMDRDNDIVIFDGKNKTVDNIAQVNVINGSNEVEKLDNSDISIYDGNEYNEISLVPQSYSFNGSGWGHGLGMSQWGAFEMANEDYDYEEILAFYYNGAQVK